jgi:cellulose synthase/poly-beta-1,6-N-acetylglucosamine synthase-like glycosyltransferase
MPTAETHRKYGRFVSSANFTARRPLRSAPSITDYLVQIGRVSPAQVAKLYARRAREDASLLQILQDQASISDAEIAEATAEIYTCEVLEIADISIDVSLLPKVSHSTMLRLGFFPIKEDGGVLLIGVVDFDALTKIKLTIARSSQIRFAVLTRNGLITLISRRFGQVLSQGANTACPAAASCRSLDIVRPSGRIKVLFALLVILCTAALTYPMWALYVVILATVIANISLRIVAVVTNLWASKKPIVSQSAPRKLDRFSILVPLNREVGMLNELIENLSALNYPKSLVEVLVVIEGDDFATRQALAEKRLPRWFQVITVPPSTIQTKPRAMNLALNFCTGSIIGVFDAEDRPDPEQLHKVIKCFEQSPENTKCVQGVLDFHNPKRNWVSHCFSLEYATWFRVFLPGFAKLGMPIPLGGTTLFLKRDVLDVIGAWDAHNVTEDADLGIRLLRHGFGTAVLSSSTTYEEANYRPSKWVKQRSRWLKGYAITWGVHCRHPGRLLRAIGPRNFLVFQVMFLGTLSTALLFPLILSLWAIPLGLINAEALGLNNQALFAMMVIFILSEVIQMGLNVVGAIKAGRPWLIFAIPLLQIYWLLASFAVYKGLAQLFIKPFYWEKTEHGINE